MLTRLEVDGFKNLLNLHVDFGPFTCIAGPNAVGKSNVFDAIEFLSALADHSLSEAPNFVRVTNKRGANPRELFWTDGEHRAERMRFAVEMLVPGELEDELGRQIEPSATFLRYELELVAGGPTQADPHERLILRHEQLTALGPDHLRFPHAQAFRAAVMRGAQQTRDWPFVSTEQAEADRTIHLHADQRSGRRSSFPASRAKATTVSSASAIEHPTLYAVRREMQSWRQLALEPAAMRRPDEFFAPKHVDVNGANIASTLFALAHAKRGEETPDPEATYAELANLVSRLIPARSIRVVRDEQRGLLTLELHQGGAGFVPARALSDGTLRFLALAILHTEPNNHRVLCMEEPENGLHPARLAAMVELLFELSVDPDQAPAQDNPLRQLIVNTHSPGIVGIVHERHPGSLLAARPVMIRSPRGKPVRTLRLMGLRDTWRGELDDQDYIDRIGLLDYQLRQGGSSYSDQAVVPLGVSAARDGDP